MAPLRIAQISDLHFTKVTLNPFRLFSKRFLGLINWLFCRRSHFNSNQLDELPEFLSTLNLDHIFLGGDFTSTALPSEFEQAKSFVQKLPAPCLAIPGNHDHYTYRAYRKHHFYKALPNKRGPVEHKADFFTLQEHGIEAHRLNPTWWVIALDTSRATNLYSSRGLFSPKMELRLLELLSLLPKEHSILLLNHYPVFQNENPRRALSRAEALETILKSDSRIKAYLQGHSHRHTIANLQPSNLPLILDSGCSAHSKRGTWNLLTLDNKGVQIDVYQWNQRWTLAKQEYVQWTR